MGVVPPVGTRTRAEVYEFADFFGEFAVADTRFTGCDLHRDRVKLRVVALGICLQKRLNLVG